MLGKRTTAIWILLYCPEYEIGLAFVPYGIILLSISYSHTTTEWSQPRARSQIEEDTEDREETVQEEKEQPEPHNHGETRFQVLKDKEAQW